MLKYLAVVAALAACGGDDSSSGPSFTITNPGTGDANAQPLLPLHVGYEGLIPDLGPLAIAIVDGTLPDSNGTLYRAVAIESGYVQWYLVTDDGVFAAGNAVSGRLDHPTLFAPATVRDGMTWKTSTFVFAVAHTGDGLWRVTGTPETGEPLVYDFVEGLGLAGAKNRLVVRGGTPDLALPHLEIATEEIAMPTDSGGISLLALSMVTRPDGHALMSVGGGIGPLGTDLPSRCFSTDGKTVTASAFVRQAPISSSTDGQCIQAPLTINDENGTPLTQYIASGHASSAFVRADGTVFYFGRLPGGSLVHQDNGSIQLDLGYIPLFFLPGANAATDPPTLVQNCNNCISADYMQTIPFDQALVSTAPRGQIPVPWDLLQGENVYPIRDEEGGTSFLIVTHDHALWTSTLTGPPHLAGRVPGNLSMQARVGGNEILRVVADGSVDRLRVSNGVLSLEHLGDVELPAGEIAEAAFVWHGDSDGDHLLLFSSFYDDSFLGSQMHLRRSTATLAPGTLVAIPNVLQLTERAIGSDDDLVCAPNGVALPTEGWTVGGIATRAFALPDGCVMVLAPTPLTDNVTAPGLREVDVPGLGPTAFALRDDARSDGGFLAYRQLETEVHAELARPIAAVPGDRFVTATARLLPGASEVDLAHVPQIVPTSNGAQTADRAGHGLWVETATGIALVGPTTDQAIASTSGMKPGMAMIGGGVIGVPFTGTSVAVTPAGTQIPLPDVGANHTVLEVLADGTQCGTTLTTFFCLPPTGPERTAAANALGGFIRMSLADGSIYFQAPDQSGTGATLQFVLDPTTMVIASLGALPIDAPPISYFTTSYAADGSVYVRTNNGTLAEVNATGFHPITFDAVTYYRFAFGEHLFVASSDGRDLVRIPR